MFAIITVFILLIVVFLVFLRNYSPKYDLSKFKVDNLEQVDEIYSPNHQKVVNVYLRRGDLFRTDYMYIGQLKDLKKHTQRNILLLDGQRHKILWVDNEHLKIDEKKISINQTYDFRKN